MKTLLKLALPIVAVAGIAYFIITSTGGTDPTESESARSGASDNKYVKNVETEIEAFDKIAYGKSFRKDAKASYVKISDLIANYHNDRLLDKKSPSRNDDERNSLITKLFDKYVDKFIGYALFVFKGTEWDTGDLDFIQSECLELRKSEISGKGGSTPLLESGSWRDKIFTEMQGIRREYNAINGFIGACEKFSPAGAFPMDDVKNKIKEAENYQNKKFTLKNETFPLCRRTRKKLGEVPQILFKRHVAFLNNKIEESLGMYDGFDTQGKYVDAVWKNVDAEIKKLDNDVYKVDDGTFKSKQKELRDKWNAEINRSRKYCNDGYRDKIKKYLNGDTLNTDQLRDYKDIDKYGTPKKAAASIDLCLEFWSLDGSNGKTYHDLYNKAAADENLKNSGLKKTLGDIEDDTKYGHTSKTVILNLLRR